MTYKDNCGLRKSDFTDVSTPSVLPVLYIIPRPRYTKKMAPVSMSISIREINRIKFYANFAGVYFNKIYMLISIYGFVKMPSVKSL